VHNDIIALLPIDRCGDAVLVAELERVHYSEDFIEGSANLCGVGDSETDNLLWVDHEHLQTQKISNQIYFNDEVSGGFSGGRNAQFEPREERPYYVRKRDMNRLHH
jgi:hypothetical protein